MMIHRSLNSQRIFFQSLIKNCNHKGLGIYYLLSAFIFGISGTLISVLIRIELYSSGNRIISPENQNFYNISITLHGFLMIFFLVMPGLFGGFGNYFVVIFQGSPEVLMSWVSNRLRDLDNCCIVNKETKESEDRNNKGNSIGVHSYNFNKIIPKSSKQAGHY